MSTINARGSGDRRNPEPRLLTIARVLKPWGVAGGLKLEVLTSFPDQLGRLQQVYLGPEAIAHPVERFRWHRDDLILYLADVRDRAAAQSLAGQEIQIATQDAAALEPNQFYEHQILGLEAVTDEGESLGHVSQILTTGANDVYVVQGPRGEILLPARIEVIRQVDLEHGRMIVHLLPGLVPGEE